MGYPLNKDEIAFSDPTPDGIKFAANYTGTTSFLVFRKWFCSECWKGWSYEHFIVFFSNNIQVFAYLVGQKSFYL